MSKINDDFVDISEIIDSGQCEISAKNVATLILALRVQRDEIEDLRERLWELGALRDD